VSIWRSIIKENTSTKKEISVKINGQIWVLSFWFVELFILEWLSVTIQLKLKHKILLRVQKEQDQHENSYFENALTFIYTCNWQNPIYKDEITLHSFYKNTFPPRYKFRKRNIYSWLAFLSCIASQLPLLRLFGAIY
jgi:hypothetical protein